MKRLEDECVECPPEMGCLGSSCPNRNVERIYCDICGDEISYDSKRWDPDKDYHLCEDCKEEA